MAIKYNPNKKTIFNNYIDTAVSNLKRAETETSCILNFTFPSKTIIGRRFNKKSGINTLKGNINSAYTSLSSVKADVQEQVGMYLTANSIAMNIGESLIIHLKEVKREFSSERKMGIPGYTYDELDRMSWYDSEKLLYEYYLKSPYVGTIDYDEYVTVLSYVYKDGYVPQASTFLDDDERYISVCFLKEQTEKERKAGKEREGNMVVIDLKTGETKWEQPFKSHANDMTSIVEDQKLIIPDHKDGEHGEWNIYKYNIDKDGNVSMELEDTIKNINSDALDYDATRKEIVVLNGEKVYAYDKDVVLNKELSSDERKAKREFMVPDEIHDYQNNEHYTTRGGMEVENGEMTLAYGGFSTSDTNAYENEDSHAIGNMYVTVNTDTAEPIGYYKDTVPQESEGVNSLKDGRTAVTMNYGSEVRVCASDDTKYKKETIASDYKKGQTMTAKANTGRDENIISKSKK